MCMGSCSGCASGEPYACVTIIFSSPPSILGPEPSDATTKSRIACPTHDCMDTVTVIRVHEGSKPTLDDVAMCARAIGEDFGIKNEYRRS